MKKLIAAFLTLCIVSFIIPAAPDNGSGNTGINLCGYSVQEEGN